MWDKAIESLYSRLILRDVFAKMMPGLIVLWATAVVFLGQIPSREQILTMNWWVLSILLGIGWLVGLGVQGVGEITGLQKYHPKDVTDECYWTMMSEYGELSPARAEDKERMVVIQESTANGFVAIALTLATLILDVALNTEFREAIRGNMPAERLWVVGVLPLAAAVGLFWLNRKHTARMWKKVAAEVARA